MIISASLISGIIIIVVALITLVRIIKPILEALIVVALVFIGSALIFHSYPSIPGTNIPTIGLNIIGISQVSSNESIIVLFNAYPLPISNISVYLNSNPVKVLSKDYSLSPGFGAVLVGSNSPGRIEVKGTVNLYGIPLSSIPAYYNYS
ncbi:MAG: hypothetical protein OH318_00520 [Candidatus Parvarchaeota archaeon]|nr:hypothetical protein [Candidatus Rehaiarchaeum fermentans]MCW1292867.1 hypothetical protein [Candidatus Rehaiarchaeum fermentans]MCW1293361.1 hypothetical protein [Candidatus Rehaiarchaeum fermentans]